MRKKQAKGIGGICCNNQSSLKLAKSSDDLLPKCRSPVIKKKEQMMEIISELQGCTNQLTKCNLAFKILKLCSEVEGTYAKEMKTVVSVIGEVMFLPKDKIENEILLQIYENKTEAILSSETIPSTYVIQASKALLTRYKNENLSLKSQVQQLSTSNPYLDIKLMLKEKDSELNQLQSYINSNITEPLKQKNNELSSAEELYSNACKSIDELKEIIDTNEIIIRKLRLQNSNHTKIIYNYQCEEEKLKFTIEELNKKISQLNKEIKELHEENYKKQYYLEITLMKIKASIDREKFFESRNAELESENQKLNSIYKNGSQFLTPRPSFSGLEEVLGTDPMTSSEKVKKLINLIMLKSSRRKSKKVLRKQLTTLTPRSDFSSNKNQ